MRLIARHDGLDIDVDVERHGNRYRVRIGNRSMEADFVDVGGFIRSLRLTDGTHYALIHHREGNRHEITIGGATIRVEIFDPLALRRKRREDEIVGGGVVKALMPGRVVRVMVNKGDTVHKGSGLLILEAMKMENEIQATADGVVDEIFVSAGDTVEGGAELIHIA